MMLALPRNNSLTILMLGTAMALVAITAHATTDDSAHERATPRSTEMPTDQDAV